MSGANGQRGCAGGAQAVSAPAAGAQAASAPAVPCDAAHMQQMYDCCVRGTREFVQGAGFSDCVIGLSGGIDSGLVAAIAVEALGAAHVHGVLLPGPYSSEHSVSDALDLAARLGISTCTIGIDEPYRAFERVLLASGGPGLDALHGAADGAASAASAAPASASADAVAADAPAAHLSGLTAQNVQARSRMVIIMALSNEHGWLMLNTGNRTEAYMGYSTLYGDMAGAYAPIGGLWKTQVFAMANQLNERACAAGGQPPIPQHMISKPPSAELAEGQTDEASLGIAYADLDRILHAHVDGGFGREALIDAGFACDQVELVLRRIAGSAFKRPLEPPYPDTLSLS